MEIEYGGVNIEHIRATEERKYEDLLTQLTNETDVDLRAMIAVRQEYDAMRLKQFSKQDYQRRLVWALRTWQTSLSAMKEKAIVQDSYWQDWYIDDQNHLLMLYILFRDPYNMDRAIRVIFRFNPMAFTIVSMPEFEQRMQHYRFKAEKLILGLRLENTIKKGYFIQ